MKMRKENKILHEFVPMESTITPPKIGRIMFGKE
jgi:hypothetical protein